MNKQEGDDVCCLFMRITSKACYMRSVPWSEGLRADLLLTIKVHILF